MKKIIIISVLLLLPAAVLAAADDLTFDADTNINVGGNILVILSGAIVDDMTIGDTTVTFSLSTNSGLTLRSDSRKILTNSFNVDVLCGTSYSQISVDGDSLGSSFVVTPSGSTCILTTGGGGSTGGGGGGSAPPAVPSMPTTSTGEVTATAAGGGKTTLTTGESTTAAVEMPANAVSAPTDVAIEAVEQSSVIASCPITSTRSVVGSYVYDYTATSGGTAVSQFDKDLILTLTYTDTQIEGLEESTLRVFYWKESTSVWVALPTTVEAGANTLIAEVDHFTYFAIMGLPTGEEEGDIVEEDTGDIVDGDLIRNSSASGMAQFDIYIVKLINGKKFKRLIISPHVFESYEHFDKNGDGSPWDDVVDVSEATMAEYTVSDLVRAVGDEEVYKLSASTGADTGTKQWMNMTASAFSAAGYDWDSIYEINATDRNAYTTGTDITS